MTLVFQIAAGVLVGLIAWNYLSVLLWVIALAAIAFVGYWVIVWLVLVVRNSFTPTPHDPARTTERDEIRRKVEEISRE